MQGVRDIVEIVSLKEVPVVGLMLLIIVALAYIVNRMQNNITRLRDDHKKEIQSLNDRHAEKIEELTNKLMEEIRKNGEAYQQSANALQMILKSKGNERS